MTVLNPKVLAVVAVVVGWIAGPLVALSSSGRCINRCDARPSEVCQAVCITGPSSVRVAIGSVLLVGFTGLGVWLWRRRADRSGVAVA